MASDGTLIRTDTALAAADQADIYWAITHSTGQILHLGRTRRIATLPQTIALYARDKGCSFPGCDTPAGMVRTTPHPSWAEGGLTDLNNLTLLCAYHHHNFLSQGLGMPNQRSRRSRMDTALVDRPRNPDDQRADPRRHGSHRTPTTR